MFYFDVSLLKNNNYNLGSELLFKMPFNYIIIIVFGVTIILKFILYYIHTYFIHKQMINYSYT